MLSMLYFLFVYLFLFVLAVVDALGVYILRGKKGEGGKLGTVYVNTDKIKTKNTIEKKKKQVFDGKLKQHLSNHKKYI